MGGHPGAADMSDMSDINPDPAMAVAVTAALLDAGRVAAAIGHGSALLAGAALLATLPASGTTRLCCGLALALWPVSGWLALRVALDARLFATLDADEASFTRFDACLPALSFREPDEARHAGTCEGPVEITSSTWVFHSPHEGHLPIHFGADAPQF